MTSEVQLQTYCCFRANAFHGDEDAFARLGGNDVSGGTANSVRAFSHRGVESGTVKKLCGDDRSKRK